jgi:RND family efflux transporter MFP subunit
MTESINLRDLAVDRQDNDATPGIRHQRHFITRYLVPGVLVLGFVSVLVWTLQDRFLPARKVTIIPVHVTRSHSQQAGTPLFKSAGWVEPRPTPLYVPALAPGVVKNLLVVEDQPLKKGDPVAILVSEDANLIYKSAQADLQLADAELKAAQINFDKPVHLQAALSEAEAELARANTAVANLPFETERAEAHQKLAQQDLQGKKKASGVVSGLEIDKAESTLKAASALVQELKQRAKLLASEQQAVLLRRNALQEQLELKTEEERTLLRARALFASAEVSLEQAALQLERMTVRAPRDGRVLNLLSSDGTHVQGGPGMGGKHDGGAVITMYQPEKLQVRVDVRFEDLPQIQRGQPVQIESPAVPTPLQGTVLFLSSLADIQKNTLEVKVAIEDSPEVIKPEMLVDVTFLAPERPDASKVTTESVHLFVPKNLVHEDANTSYVWIADQAARVARKTPVETGSRGSRNLIEITAGLTETSKLIAAPDPQLQDQDRILVTGEDPSPIDAPPAPTKP